MKPAYKVELVRCMTTEDELCEIARTCTKRTDKPLYNVRGMIKCFLNPLLQGKEPHWGVFEHASVQYRITCPKFCFDHLIRHRVLKIAEEQNNSLANVPEYNEIEDLNADSSSLMVESQRQSCFQGDVDYYMPEKLYGNGHKPLDKNTEKRAKVMINQLYMLSNYTYKELLKIGISKEQTRIALLPSHPVTFWLTCSLRNAMNFIKIRTEPCVQDETRWLTFAMLNETEKKYPISIGILRKFLTQRDGN